MKVSIDNSTGLIIESQENADDTTLQSNALNAGFLDVTVKTVTDAECEAMLKFRDDSRKTYVQHRSDAFATKSVGEQMDMQYWDSVNGTTIWRDWVAGIKTQFPKV